MSTSSDIESLYKRFGGDADRYQEIRAEADSEWARARWPLLDLVELHDHALPAPSRAASSGAGPGRFEACATRERAANDATPVASALPFAIPPTHAFAAIDGGRRRNTFDATDDVPALPLPSPKAAPAPETPADARHADPSGRASGTLKKLLGKPAAPDATHAPAPSEPLVRLFDRLRAVTRKDGVTARLPARTHRP